SRLGFLTIWPPPQQMPTVSTLNNPTGTIVANAAIVPAGTGGDVDVFVHDSTDVIIDVDGYFWPRTQGGGGLALYSVAPCRAFDSRNGGGAFQGEKSVDISGSQCAPPSNAGGYVFNATVVPHGSLGYLTLWPDGEGQPVVSTLNAVDGAVTSN